MSVRYARFGEQWYRYEPCDPPCYCGTASDQHHASDCPAAKQKPWPPMTLGGGKRATGLEHDPADQIIPAVAAQENIDMLKERGQKWARDSWEAAVENAIRFLLERVQ